MRVKALKTIGSYYSIEKDNEYEVLAIVYFATPYVLNAKPQDIDVEQIRTFVNPIYSYGVIRNECVYILRTTTDTGRETLARFNTSNFEVTDGSIPENWRTSVIDLYEEVYSIQESINEARLEQILEELKNFSAKIIVTGNEEIHTPTYLYSVCDDSLNG